MQLRLWPNTSTKAARKLVGSVMRAHQGPVTTQQLYKLVVRHEYEAADRMPPSHSEHVHSKSVKPLHPSNIVRSMRYLKGVVLPDLLQRKEVEKVHTIRTLSKEEIELRLKSMTKAARRSAEVATTADTWVWQRRTPPAKTEPKPPKERPGLVVGAEEDWAHLNKRRQRARLASVKRDMAWMKQLDKARREGLTMEESLTL